jgi:hypothetical protein
MSTTQNRESLLFARVGGVVGLLAAVGAVAYALWMLVGGIPNPLPFKLAFFFGGLLEAVCCAYALLHNRTGWALAVALNGALTLLFFFGSAKVRDGFDVSLAMGFLPCVLFGVVTVLLALGQSNYERT